jgi:SAM-dependent methyltransferase
MYTPQQRSPTLTHVFAAWWRDQRSRHSLPATFRALVQNLWEFARSSTPEQRRRRFGDVDFDFDHHVNTTSATVSWRDRLMGTFSSPYQPTDPGLFDEMLRALGIDFRSFTFIDLGSGKGRVLLMAAAYPFHRIIGVELLPTLHRIAEENVRAYRSASQQCFAIANVCADAADFVFPDQPLILYLFNPLIESQLKKVVAHLESSTVQHPRPVSFLYHNPLLPEVLTRSGTFNKVGGTQQYFVLANEEFSRLLRR